jgi:WD repeat-containing protein 68
MSGGSGLFIHSAEQPVYAMNWSVRQDAGLRLAVGSLVEGYQNEIYVLNLDEQRGVLQKDEIASFNHPWPATHLQFFPSCSTSKPDILASSGDVVRLWRLRENNTTILDSVLKDVETDTGIDPGAVTCFDWNDLDTSRIISGSTNGLLTVWDIDTCSASQRLKAHQGEVFDCQWGAVDVVASCSSDSSVRLLDLRDAENCTLLFESTSRCPIVRLDWNKIDPRFMAVATANDPNVLILDLRRPNVPLQVLNQHKKACNAIHWSAHVPGRICTASDDETALIWSTGNLENAVSGTKGTPDLVYSAGSPINQIYWNLNSPNWLAITSRNTTRIMKV